MDINLFKIKKNRAQGVFIGIMVFIMVFITIVALIEPLKQVFSLARDVGHLDCDNPATSASIKSTCLVVDWAFFYFVAVCIAAGFYYITGKKSTTQ